MAYRRLSELRFQLENSQQNASVIRRFKEAARTGIIEAAYNSEIFDSPQVYRMRGSTATHKRKHKNLIYMIRPAFDKWYEVLHTNLHSNNEKGW